MSKRPTIGLVVPHARDEVPAEGPIMYPDAIMVIGTSLTFYKGAAVHRRLLEQLRAATGLPVSTMSQAVVDGLRAVGAKKVAVATAYDGEVNRRLKDFL